MEWLNEHSGLIMLVGSIIIVILVAVAICMLYRLHSKIAVQRLNFLGFYSIDKDTKTRYADMTIGNKSLNDIGISELGIQNGKIKFPLTDKYKRDSNMLPDARIVIEQRSSISFKLSCEELRSLVVELNGKHVLKSLRIYAVDLTGTLYRGRVPDVKKLIKEMLLAEKQGMSYEEYISLAKNEAAATDVKPSVAPAAPAEEKAEEPAEAETANEPEVETEPDEVKSEAEAAATEVEPEKKADSEEN